MGLNYATREQASSRTSSETARCDNVQNKQNEKKRSWTLTTLPSTSTATMTRSCGNAPSLVASKVNTEDGAVNGAVDATISNGVDGLKGGVRAHETKVAVRGGV